MRRKSNMTKDLHALKCAEKGRPCNIKKAESKDFIWWEKQFDELAKEFKTPDYKRIKHLKKMYSDKEVRDIVESGVEIVKDKCFSFESEDLIQPRNRRSDAHFRKSKSAPVQSTKMKYSNPFIEFMNKSENDARSWYPKPENKLENVPIIERAEKIKKAIVKKYVKKFQSVAKSKVVTESTVSSRFEMTCPFPISESVNSSNEICGAVPDTTAHYLGCYELSQRNKLTRQIFRDIEASEISESKTAFGQNLPTELRRLRFKDNPDAKWLCKKSQHENLESFAVVFKNITELESTRKFCQYLLDHPNVKPPQFLKDEGMLIKKILKKPVYLGNLESKLGGHTSFDMSNMDNILEKVNKTMADFNCILTKAAAHKSSVTSLGEASDINIMV